MSTHDYVGDITPWQKERCEQSRNLFKALEAFIQSQPENGKRTFSDRCLSITKTKLEEASMYAIKAIVFEGKEVVL